MSKSFFNGFVGLMFYVMIGVGIWFAWSTVHIPANPQSTIAQQVHKDTNIVYENKINNSHDKALQFAVSVKPAAGSEDTSHNERH
jgi:hypothetical protein